MDILDTSGIEKLLDVLDKEAVLYETILDMSRNKTKIVVEGKVSELDKIVKLEQSFIMQMRRLEDSREKLITDISNEIGVDAEHLTISELTKFINGNQCDKLKDCQKKMKKTFDELQSTNNLNSKLINNSLEYIDFSINLFTAAGSLDNNYGSTGHTDGTKKQNLFDVKL